MKHWITIKGRHVLVDDDEGSSSLRKQKSLKKSEESLLGQLPKNFNERKEALGNVLSKIGEASKEKASQQQRRLLTLPNSQPEPSGEKSPEVGKKETLSQPQPQPSEEKPKTGVFVQVHEVTPLGIHTQKNHTSLRVVPTNQLKYASDSRFKNRDENGNVFMTLGADGTGFGWPPINRVYSDINRRSDVHSNAWKNNNYQFVPTPSNYADEDAFIKKIIEFDQNFEDGKWNYNFAPESGDDGYNSNSYTAGLLRATGVKNPPTFNVTTPGYEKPFPSSHFRKRKKRN